MAGAVSNKDERIWDGRGDALGDARLSIAAGRLADDLRAKVLHFRVMAHVGRQNHARGWLRVSQSELAERWQCHRVTLNRAFKDLVEWGYLVQRTQEEAGESFCLYKVDLDGGDDTDRSPPARAPAKVKTARRDGGECSPETTHVQSGGYTCVAGETTPPINRARAHRLSPTYADNKTHTHSPVAVCVSEGSIGNPEEAAGWADGWTEDARAEVGRVRSSAVVAHVADPFIAMVRGTLRPQKGADPVAYVRQLSRHLREFSPHVLAAAADALVAERNGRMPGIAELLIVVRAAKAKLAVEAAAANGSVVVSPGDPTLAARWPDVLIDLRRRIGADVVAAWFSKAVPLRREEDAIVIVAPALHARWIRQNFEPAALAACRSVWRDVARVIVETQSGRAAA